MFIHTQKKTYHIQDWFSYVPLLCSIYFNKSTIKIKISGSPKCLNNVACQLRSFNFP